MNFSIDALYEGILRRDRRTLAKAISLVESTRREDFTKSQELIERLLPHAGASYRIGISGVPGVGKSTFIEAFGSLLLDEGKRVAVLAIDPSSQRTGGSILGDKTRMIALSRREESFIRPSPAGGSLGGVARKTRESILLCEAAGYDVILVETVGVGQSEISVAGMTDFFLALMLANAGDELQGIKRGIMEMADAIVINKADGIGRESAEAAARQFQNALHYFLPKSPDWTPRALTCSSLEKIGIKAVWEMIQDFFHQAHRAGRIEEIRGKQALEWLHSLLKEEVISSFFADANVRKNLPEFEKAVLEQRKSPSFAAFELLNSYKQSIFEEKS